MSGDQRQDDDHPPADGRRSARTGRGGREQRDGLEHAAGPRGGAGGHGRRQRGPRGGRGLPAAVLTATAAAAVVLLNLSRDQLDRTNEVRMVAGRWRAALAAAPAYPRRRQRRRPPRGVGGRGGARDVHWVGAGLRWQLDAVGCPSCEGRIEFGEGPWSCASLRLRPARARSELVLGRTARPTAVWADGRTHPSAARTARTLQPGQCPDGRRGGRGRAGRRRTALHAMERCRGGGRVASPCAPSATSRRASCWPRTRQAGTSCSTWWPGRTAPLVVSINARVADGADPSWLWDVPFERLAGRTVVATGDRFRDLSVRLHYAGVAHTDRSGPGAGGRRRGGWRRRGAGRRDRQLHRVPRSPGRAA